MKWLRAVLEIVYVFMYSYTVYWGGRLKTPRAKNPNTEHESYFSLIKINHDFIIAKVQ